MIRRLIPSDIPAVLELWLRSTKQAHPFIAPGYWDENTGLVKDMLTRQAETYVFADKRRIKGFVSLLPENFIGALFVDEKFRSCRIGTKLLNYILRRRSAVSLHVYAANRPAVDFYRRNGFKIIMEQTDISSGQPELLMARACGSFRGISRRPGES